MKVSQVEVKDFLTIDSASFNLSDAGLVLIQGVNETDTAADSNGSGKSSLMDAVCWCLWGNTARDEAGDRVIRDGSSTARVKIMLVDEDAGETYIIDRQRKKGKGLLSVSRVASTVVELTLGTEKMTQGLIARILGCSEEVFRAAVYCGQESLPNLPTMTDRQLKQLVEEAAGVTVFETAYQLARDHHREVKDSHDSQQRTVETLQTRQQWLAAAMTKFQVDLQEWDDRREQKQCAKQQEIINANESIRQVARMFALLRSEANILRDISYVDAQLNALKPARQTEQQLAKVLSDAEIQVSVLAAGLKRLIENYKILKAEIVTIDSAVGQPCSECGTTMTDDHVAVAHGVAVNRVAATGADVTIQRGKWDAAKIVAEEAKASLEAFKLTMQDPATLSAARARLVKEETARRDTYAELERANKVLKTLAAESAAIDAEINPLIAARDSAIQESKNLEDRIKGQQLILAGTQSDLNAAECVLKVFGPSGVRAHILDTVTPFLNERTAEYLGTLTDGRINALWTTLVRNAKGEVREKFSIEINHVAGDRGFKGISGGEKRKVRIACALALQDLVASRATKPFKLWIGDELDDALDAAGQERLMMILQEKARERGTVMIISHNDLKSWIPNVWTVTKTNDKSTLSI